MGELTGSLLALNVGKVGVLRQGAREIETAYLKKPVVGPLRLGKLGFPGDEHVYEHHGGPDKAVCVYPHAHYGYWAERLGLDMPESAAFGENFTVSGLTEREVWIGDVFEIGEAVVQVTVPRAPCYKIAARYGQPKMALFVQKEGYTGYLFRVLREGDVEAGQELRLMDRQDHGVTVAEANRVLNVDRRDKEGARRLLAVPALADAVRPGLLERIGGPGLGEDTERLYGD
ncbi:MOSC domain-containing protein [Streptomyces sp. NPDC004542]|uniref:MOSC domain-containing protein n=1 Tax=Streptomyces sp. NPDC004542 TaxID=3154281 RepID=UPI0033B153CD